jgi:hypothetical protein
MGSVQWVLTGALVLPFLVADRSPARAQETDKDQAAEAGRLIAQEIAKIEMRSGSGDDVAPLERSNSSILHWTNPTLGTIYGDVFVWTRNGRPMAVASIFKFYSPFTIMSIEFQSFSTEPFEATFDGEKIWSPGVEEVEFLTLSGAPEPSPAKFARLRQMRSLAESFSVDATVRTDDSITRRLRMLPQPIFRHDSRDPDVMDGAIFAFVEGTDPELLILIEARKTKDGFEWQYAIGRMNSLRFEVRRDDKAVWSGEKLAPPWPDVRTPEKGYFNLPLGNVALEPESTESAPNDNPASDRSIYGRD